MSAGDRTVHAVLSDGRQVVRYDRSGKWWVEGADGLREQVTVGTAAQLATERGACVVAPLPGGQRFEAIVRRYRGF